MIGGVCINTGHDPVEDAARGGALPDRDEPARHLRPELPGQARRSPPHDLFWRMTHVIRRRGRRGAEPAGPKPRARRSAARPGSSIRTRSASRGEDGEERRLTASRILIAVGTRPARPASVELRRAHDPRLRRHPRPRLDPLVAGGGGRRRDRHRVRLHVRRARHQGDGDRAARRGCCEFCDSQVVEALQYHLRDLGVIFRFGEKVVGVEKHPTRRDHPAGQRQAGAGATPCSTRPAARAPTDGLELGAGRARGGHRGAGSPSTAASAPRVRHIYAAGDVIGFPSLAASSMEQGRLAALRRVRRCRTIASAAPDADRHLHDPRDQLRRQDRGGADRGGDPVRDRRLPLPGAGAGPDRRRLPRDAEAAGLARGRQRCSASTCSAPARRSWCTSARC